MNCGYNNLTNWYCNNVKVLLCADLINNRLTPPGSHIKIQQNAYFLQTERTLHNLKITYVLDITNEFSC